MIHKRMTDLGSLSVALVLGSIGVATTHATVVVPMADAEIVRQSGLILEGTVTNVSSSWNAAGTQIYTFIDISITKLLKGSYRDQTMKLRVLGGVVGNVGMMIVDSPTFVKDEETVLFLRPNPQSLFPVVGFNQGKFTLEVDKISGNKMVRERNLLRDEFLKHVVAIIADQERGAIDAQRENAVGRLEPTETQEKEGADDNE